MLPGRTASKLRRSAAQGTDLRAWGHPTPCIAQRRTVTDLEMEHNTVGALVAALSVVSSGMQQIFCRSMQQKHGLSSHELLANTAPAQVGPRHFRHMHRRRDRRKASCRAFVHLNAWHAEDSLSHAITDLAAVYPLLSCALGAIRLCALESPRDARIQTWLNTKSDSTP